MMAVYSAFSEYLFLVQFGPAVVQSVPVLAIDLADPGMNILYATPLLHEMFGYDDKELIGYPLDVLLRPEDVVKHHEHFRKYQKNPTTRSMNEGIWVPGKHKDGNVIYVQVSLCKQPVGKLDCIIACIADVTAAYKRQHLEIVTHGQVRPEGGTL